MYLIKVSSITLERLYTMFTLLLDFTFSPVHAIQICIVKGKITAVKTSGDSPAIFGGLSEIFAVLVMFKNLRRTSGDFWKSSGHLRQSSEGFVSSSEIVGIRRVNFGIFRVILPSTEKIMKKSSVNQS